MLLNTPHVKPGHIGGSQYMMTTLLISRYFGDAGNIRKMVFILRNAEYNRGVIPVKKKITN